MVVKEAALASRGAVLILTLAAALGLQGCVSPIGSANTYTAAEAQREQTVRLATVESVRAVTLSQGETTGLGAIGGGAVGAVAASALGGGRGSLLTGILGGIGGAIAGNSIEKGVGKQHGVEITVRLDNGDLRAITQNASGDVFQAGQRVRLLTGGGVTRVTL